MNFEKKFLADGEAGRLFLFGAHIRAESKSVLQNYVLTRDHRDG